MSAIMRRSARILSVLLFCTGTWLLLVASLPEPGTAVRAAIAGREDARSCPPPVDAMRRWWFGD